MEYDVYEKYMSEGEEAEKSWKEDAEEKDREILNWSIVGVVGILLALAIVY